MVVPSIVQIATKNSSDMITSYSIWEHATTAKLEKDCMTQNDSEGEPSKRKDTSSSIPTQIEQALDDALINYNVDLTKLE